MQISVFTSPELQAGILALRGMDKELQAQIRKATRSITEPEWKRALAQESITLLENRVLVSSARVTVSNQNVTLKAGQLAKRMSGGARLSDLTPSVEWGSSPDRPISQRSSRGKQYKRRQGSTFRPRNRTGYVGGPAAASIIPRIVSLWMQTTVRTFLDAVEGK